MDRFLARALLFLILARAVAVQGSGWAGLWHSALLAAFGVFAVECLIAKARPTPSSENAG